MSSNIGWFIDFFRLDGGFVNLGDNESYQVKGLGNIVLRLKNRQIILLKHTRYLPALRRNLIFIFLGVLDDENYQIEMKNSFTKI